MNSSSEKAHTPHILPLSLYLSVGGALLGLTIVTVLVASVDLGSLNLIVALMIAAFKATLVALFFMHLKYQNRLYSVIFVSALLFLSVFIILTLFDTTQRGLVANQRSGVISNFAVIYDTSGKPLPMTERDFGIAEGSVAGADGASDIPFEIQHGFGPIKEVIEVGPLDTLLALIGKPIFESKCKTCHRLDERYTGPALRGVTAYRSATFIMNQILDPAQNVAKHPDMQAMLRTYFTFMTNQNVSREDARALVEYLRWEMTRGGQTQ